MFHKFSLKERNTSRNATQQEARKYFYYSVWKKHINADLVLLCVFTLSDCQYCTEKLFSSFKPKMLYKLIKYMNENNHRFLWTTREEKICLGFGKEVAPTNISGSNTFLICSCKLL